MVFRFSVLLTYLFKYIFIYIRVFICALKQNGVRSPHLSLAIELFKFDISFVQNSGQQAFMRLAECRKFSYNA